MNLPLDLQAIVLPALFALAGYLLRMYFPNLPKPPSPPPSTVGNGELLNLLAELLKQRQTQPSPAAVTVQTASHTVALDGAGVNVTEK